MTRAAKVQAGDVTVTGMHRSQQEEAIDAASSVKELDAMWGTWEAYGYSPEGRIAARVTVRRAGIEGRDLTDSEREWITRVGLADLLPSGEE